MDSEDDFIDHETGSDTDDEEEMVPVEMIDPEPSVSSRRDRETEDFPYQVLPTEQIVLHMVDCIREVNQIVEVRYRPSLEYMESVYSQLMRDLQCS